VESHAGGVQVRGFCTKSLKLVSKGFQAAEVQKGIPLVKWKGAAQVLSHPAIARIWAHQRHTSGGGGWLEDETVDAAIRWSLYGDTRVGGLVPSGRNGYISCVTIQELQLQIQNYQEREGISTKPLLQVALEGLTGINGGLWKKVDESQLENGIELDIPVLKQALWTSLELSTEVRHQLNLRTTLAGDANADIMTSIIECVRERVQKGARTFMVKIKAHRGEPLNELADTQTENARQLPSESRQWTVRTPSMTYEWIDNNGVKQTTAWSKKVRKAMVRGGAEYQVQEAMNHAVINWSKNFLHDTNAGLHSIGQAASMGGSRRSDEQRALGEKVHAPTAERRKLEQTDNHDLGS
jgi:ribonuclease HI